MRRTIKSFVPWVVILFGVAVAVFVYVTQWRALAETYQPRLQFDPNPPAPPEWTIVDFESFLTRLRRVSRRDSQSLLLQGDGLDLARDVFRDTTGVPQGVRVEMHAPYFAVDPEAIFALFYDLPALERGMALFQQHCSLCHGPYGRGNGPATRQWYSGNYPRNFWYGKFKNRSTEYGSVPTDSDLYRSLTRGMYGSTMPPFGHLSEQDRWSLVQFIKTLASYYDDFEPAVANAFDPKNGRLADQPMDAGSEPPVTFQSVTRGRILFIEQGCATCHQEKKSKPIGLGRREGNFDWSDEMNRPIQHSRDLTTGIFRAGAAGSDLFRAISGGPNLGPMPSYGNLPAKDRWALVHYVRSVSRRDYPQAPASADAQARSPKLTEPSP